MVSSGLLEGVGRWVDGFRTVELFVLVRQPTDPLGEFAGCFEAGGCESEGVRLSLCLSVSLEGEGSWRSVRSHGLKDGGG